MKGLLRALIRRATRFYTTTVAKRQEYGRVWDSVSQSHDDARLAVAGYSDDVEWNRTGQLTAEDVFQETGIQRTDVVLEIGCGAARVGTQLAGRCAEWVGADVSRNMLDHARQALAGMPNVRLVQLDGNGLSGVATGSIDVVYCTTVFMHLDEWDRYRYCQEAYRVLKNGGRVYVDNHSLLSPEGWALFERLAKLPPNERPPHVSKASTPEELQAYVAHAGFVDARVRNGSMFVTVVARKPRPE